MVLFHGNKNTTTEIVVPLEIHSSKTSPDDSVTLVWLLFKSKVIFVLMLQNCDTPSKERISRLTCYIWSTPAEGSGLKPGACLFMVCKP